MPGPRNRGSAMTEPHNRLEHFVAGSLIVAVIETSSKHRIAPSFTRRTFFSIRAAERAVQRAHDKGLHAELVLCELRPVAADAQLR